LPIGVVLTAIFEVFFHPQREDPMDNPAVFMEYANSDSWTAVHLGQYFGFLLILGGLVALYLCFAYGPNSRSKHRSHPFSDSKSRIVRSEGRTGKLVRRCHVAQDP
jgi:hypothetical protein